VGVAVTADPAAVASETGKKIHYKSLATNPHIPMDMRIKKLGRSNGILLDLNNFLIDGGKRST